MPLCIYAIIRCKRHFRNALMIKTTLLKVEKKGKSRDILTFPSARKNNFLSYNEKLLLHEFV